jgi:hypothetical protein
MLDYLLANCCDRDAAASAKAEPEKRCVTLNCIVSFRLSFELFEKP